MTIRFLRAWNGYDDQAIASLSGAEESRLVGLGIATYFTGPVESGPEFRDMASFQAAGGSAAYEGPVWIGTQNAIIESGVAISPKKRKINIGAKKWWGGGDAGNAATTFNKTSGFKVEAEAHFSAVKFLICNGTANSPVVTGVCAVTETAQVDNQNNLARPVSGGVVKNTVDSGTEVGGWRTITRSGSSTITLAAGTSAANPAWTETDWIPLKSIARADGGQRPLLMTRFYINGSLTAWSWVSGDADSNVPTAANRGRIVQVMASDTGIADAVSTLSNNMVLNNAYMPLIVPVFRYDVPVITVAAIGDSLTENNGILASAGQEKLTNWLHRACSELSTINNPVVPVNMGYSAQNQNTFWLYAKIALPVIKSDVAFFSAFSPNDSAGTNQRLYDDMASRTLEFLAFCSDNNIAPILVTAAPNDGYNLETDNLRKSHNSFVRDIAKNNNCAVLDFDQLLSTSESPARFIPEFKFDNTHFNEVAIDSVLVSAAKIAIQNAL